MNKFLRPLWQSWHYALATIGILLVLHGCASPKMALDAAPPPPSFAKAPATSGTLADLAQRLQARYGDPRMSGFRLLDGSQEGLNWRLALIDTAQSSLDIMTYLWYPDVSGRLVLERAVQAAKRGVRVRLVIDDLLTTGQDQLLANLQAQPNIEIRLFNPWENRDYGSRAGEMIAEMERLNSRMHDKLLIADGRATIVGGRNIGDHYFGLSEAYNFHDLDVLAIGDMAAKANDMFDHFWNSQWLASAEGLSVAPDADKAEQAWAEIQKSNRSAAVLERISREPRDWSADLAALEHELEPGTGFLVFDEVAAPDINQTMGATMFALFGSATSELFITNAYVIPGDRAIDMLKRLDDSGVDVRVLTNSLESHDVPAVNSHYEEWRKPLIDAGVDLYEFRADAAVRNLIEVPPAKGEFVGLHTKAAVIDGHTVFIGSMNLDPRSFDLNTEMGAVIESPGLAARLRELMLRDMDPTNAWHVTLTGSGDLQWTNSVETRDTQPSRNFMQDIMNVVLKIVPKEQS